jgi:tRNA1Val (adenine37-N6)-methyltransferase
MPNAFFQFKQFKVNQENTSMKVCTDSCLFGAWIADKLEKRALQPRNMLDIGAGTGLLSLMIAQKSTAQIDAVEIDVNSFLQASQNCNQSKWREQIQVLHGDIRALNLNKNYDLIISNPPFFENDLKSADHNKNLAKHHSGLTLNEMTAAILKFIEPGGYFALLLPFHRVEYFKELAQRNNFFLADEMFVRQTPAHSFFRGMLLFSSKREDCSSKEMTIKNREGSYTKEFSDLLSDYYL